MTPQDWSNNFNKLPLDEKFKRLWFISHDPRVQETDIKVKALELLLITCQSLATQVSDELAMARQEMLLREGLKEARV